MNTAVIVLAGAAVACLAFAVAHTTWNAGPHALLFMAAAVLASAAGAAASAPSLPNMQGTEFGGDVYYSAKYDGDMLRELNAIEAQLQAEGEEVRRAKSPSELTLMIREKRLAAEQAGRGPQTTRAMQPQTRAREEEMRRALQEASRARRREEEMSRASMAESLRRQRDVRRESRLANMRTARAEQQRLYDMQQRLGTDAYESGYEAAVNDGPL